jgi:predicted transposase/invertase (TIGR01784 family)
MNNEIVIIEMNSTYSEGEERKYRYYLYRRAGNNYLKGKKYTDRKHTILIAFNNYLRPNMPDNDIIYSWFGDHEHNINYKDIEMYEIFLPKFYNVCYHNSNKINKRLSMFGANSYEEMRNSTSNKDDLYIIEELIRLGKMDEFIDEYDYEIVRQKLINTYKIEGHELGRTEGRVEGRAEGEKSKQLEIAKRMLEKKSDIYFISECTGLSIDEINNLN